ncbi:MAG: hypothetical protein N4A45_05440 [Flavobacteriales bacterium]|jgi:hypothetical protein|nr:hypothetical protein [Flavobacteriales bacterium]
MDLQARKIKLAQYILSQTKESVIEKFSAIMESESNTEIIAYTVSGKPLTEKEYYNKILKAEKSIEEGSFTHHDDLKKYISNW